MSSEASPNYKLIKMIWKERKGRIDLFEMRFASLLWSLYKIIILYKYIELTFHCLQEKEEEEDEDELVLWLREFKQISPTFGTANKNKIFSVESRQLSSSTEFLNTLMKTLNVVKGLGFH